MNFPRLVLAALGGTIASFAFGFLVLAVAPALFEEARKYPAVFRSEEQMMSVMPVALIAGFAAILIATMLFAMTHRTGSRLKNGLHFGMLMGLFVVFGFALHNYVNFNLGLKLVAGQAIAYFLQWTVVGAVIGLIYRPRTA